jgi:hypothetical protein
MEKRQEEEMENPPLWVWAIVVGLIIAGKYAYRWKTTKQLAKEMERRENGIGLSKDIPDRAIKKIITVMEAVLLMLKLQCHTNIAAINIVLAPLEIILK